MQKKNVSQKNVFTYADTSNSHHNINAVENEELLVAYKRKVNSKLHKKLKLRRKKIRYEVFNNDIKEEHRNDPDKHTVVSKKTIKIPYSTFVKIHNFRYPSIPMRSEN